MTLLRAASWLALLAVAPAPSNAAMRSPPRPMRVMSIGECTDQIVLALLPPERISSVTWLSRDPQTSLMVRQAANVAINRGSGEEVLRERPDLVIAGSFTTTATRQLLKRLGWPMLEIGPADTIEQIRATTRRIARAVGEEVLAEALLARMDRQLAELSRNPGPPLRVAAWDGGGFGAARGTLYDTLLTLSGAINVAADPAAVRGRAPDTELLLAAAPALLVRGGADDRDDLREDIAQSPVVRRFWKGGRSLTIRQAAYFCGTPFIGDAALALRAQLRAAARSAHIPLPFAPRTVR